MPNSVFFAAKPDNRQVSLALFCSGNGSNAQKIMEHFAAHSHIKVALLVSNNAHAYALERAKNFGVPTQIVSKSEFYSDAFAQNLKEQQIDFIVLAGFLWLVPTGLIGLYDAKILNIHPALLPDFGGKGMYGLNVHKAVKAAGVPYTGISIHVVDPHYDQGLMVFQAKVGIENADTPEQIAEKVHQLEHIHYPQIIESYIEKCKF